MTSKNSMLLLLLGCTLIIVSVVVSSLINDQSNPLYLILIKFFIATGSALFGVSIGLINDWSNTKVLYDKILSLYSKNLSSITSHSRETLSNYNRKYFLYYQTAIGDEKFWIQSELDFRSNSNLECLNAEEYVPDPSNLKKRHTYINNGYISSDRLIIIKRSISGTERSAISIYPDFTKDFKDYYCGIQLHENWSSVEMLNPTIISTIPLLDNINITRIDNINEINILKDKWQSNMKYISINFPSFHT